MTPIALIEAAATLLWTYTALTFLAWAACVARHGQTTHVTAVVTLLGHLVPAMIGLVLLVLIGAFIGLPSVVAFIAFLFPAGTAYGTHMALTEVREAATGTRDLPRVIATIALTAIIITARQLN